MPTKNKSLKDEAQTAATPATKPSADQIRAEWEQAEQDRPEPVTPNWLS